MRDNIFFVAGIISDTSIGTSLDSLTKFISDPGIKPNLKERDSDQRRAFKVILRQETERVVEKEKGKGREGMYPFNGNLIPRDNW